MENLAQNTVKFYEGSYQFKSDKTHLNISADYIQMQLAKQYEYRPTTESLWAEVENFGIKQRFSFDYNIGLTLIATF
jgi:hypothetical protein